MRGNVMMLVLFTLVVGKSSALADGGTVRFSEKREGRWITVFTAPTPLRAGPVDISVLVQDADSGRPLRDVPIVVSAQPIRNPSARTSIPATTEAATNKFLHSAPLEFSEPGWWHIEVVVRGSSSEPAIGFDVEVAEALPPWLNMSLWIGWPLAAIGFFAVHQWLVHRRRLSIT
jgi:hypothetical protein